MSQRILASHEEVATASEPWILLPYLYTLKRGGAYTDYGHRIAVEMMEDLCREMPNGVDDYLEEVRSLALGVYAKVNRSGARYFLDKTPRYHLVVEDIVSLFPEGKFIFLWRNPLAVVASIVETWGNGRWRLYHNKVDLMDGLANLVAAHQKHAQRSLAVRYEDLLTDPEEEWRRIFGYLDLPFDPGLLSHFFEVRFKGRWDDTKTARSYQTVSREPLEKWKGTLASPIRKAWCVRYLSWIGRERLEVMGYDLDVLLAELEAVPNDPRMLASDALRTGYGSLHHWVEPFILRDKLRLLPQNWRVHGHL